MREEVQAGIETYLISLSVYMDGPLDALRRYNEMIYAEYHEFLLAFADKPSMKSIEDEERVKRTRFSRGFREFFKGDFENSFLMTFSILRNNFLQGFEAGLVWCPKKNQSLNHQSSSYS